MCSVPYWLTGWPQQVIFSGGDLCCFYLKNGTNCPHLSPLQANEVNFMKMFEKNKLLYNGGIKFASIGLLRYRSGVSPEISEWSSILSELKANQQTANQQTPATPYRRRKMISSGCLWWFWLSLHHHFPLLRPIMIVQILSSRFSLPFWHRLVSQTLLDSGTLTYALGCSCL